LGKLREIAIKANQVKMEIPERALIGSESYRREGRKEVERR
jgi:hypothetical protein